LSKCNPSVFQTMTNTRGKFSGGGGDVAPSPRSPASSGDGKKPQRTASVPIENCLTAGVQSRSWGTTGEQLLPNETVFARKRASRPPQVVDSEQQGPRWCLLLNRFRD